MKLSKEVLLLQDLLNNKNYENDNLIELVQELCDGMYNPIHQREKIFLKTKLCFFFLMTALNQNETNELNIYFPFTWNATMSWKSLFEVSLKSSIIDSLFFIVFFKLPKNIVSVVIQNYCLEITQSKCCHDEIVSLCVLTSNLLHQPNNQAEEHLCQLIDQWLVKYDKNTCLEFLSHYHILGLQQALELLDTKASVSFENVGDYDIFYLKKLRHISEIYFKDISDLFCHDELFKNMTSFNAKENRKTSDTKIVSACMIQYVCKLISLLDKYSKILSNSLKRSNIFEVYSTVLLSYLKQIKTIQLLNSQSLISCDQNNFHSSWDFKSALFCATNLLDGYDDAVKFLLNFILKDSSSSEAFKCLKALLSVPECMIKTYHILDLCKIIQVYQEHNYHEETLQECLKAGCELLWLVYQLLPLKSKIYLLKQRCTPGFLFYTDIKLHACNKALNQKVNLVFNKTNKNTNSGDNNDFIHSICNIAFIDPELSLIKIVEQVACHKEYHNLLFKLFNSIPNFLVMEDKQNANNLVGCFVSVIKKNHSENAANNICDFISLFFDICSRNVSVYLAEQILQVSLQFLSSWHAYILENNLVMVYFAFKSIKCISDTLSHVKLFKLFALVHILACIVDKANGVISDILYAEAKFQLLNTVAILSLRVTEKEVSTEKLCCWLKHMSSCLLWTTKLYLRPILQNCSEYYVTVPASIQSICSLPETDKFYFDVDYGEGTGLTVWLQCLIINPDLFSISSLNVDNLSVEDQQWFKHGIVVALSQVLPFCLEDDWHIVVEALKGLLSQHYLYVTYPINRIKTFPLLNLRQFHSSLCLLELLHCVNKILHSSCCKSWMSSMLWMRYTKYYAITVKHLFFAPCDIKNVCKNSPEQLFFVSQLFFYVCDFLMLLETISNTKNACESLHMLLLDLLMVFCNMHESSLSMKNVLDSNLMHDLLVLKSFIQIAISAIKNSQVQLALKKKLTSLNQI